MDAVRRSDDGELCGFVAPAGGAWTAHVVFGSVIGVHDTRDAAVQHVLVDGLPSLAERWTLRTTATGAEEVVCIQEAHPRSVRVALGYYSMPGVPVLTLTAEQLAAGEYELLR